MISSRIQIFASPRPAKFANKHFGGLLSLRQFKKLDSIKQNYVVSLTHFKKMNGLILYKFGEMGGIAPGMIHFERLRKYKSLRAITGSSIHF